MYKKSDGGAVGVMDGFVYKCSKCLPIDILAVFIFACDVIISQFSKNSMNCCKPHKNLQIFHQNTAGLHDSALQWNRVSTIRVTSNYCELTKILTNHANFILHIHCVLYSFSDCSHLINLSQNKKESSCYRVWYSLWH